MNKKNFPVRWIKLDGFNFFQDKNKRQIKKNSYKKKTLESYVLKLKVWIYLLMFSYWDRNGGFGRVKSQVLNWLGFDEITKIDNIVGLQCLIVASNIHKFVMVIFAGTGDTGKHKNETRKDWKINAQIKHKDFDKIFVRLVKMFPESFKGLNMPENCGEGHTGYVTSVMSGFNQIWPVLRKYYTRKYDVYTGGHSKGGGESVIFTYMLVKLLGLTVKENVTIGQPRALDKEAAGEFNRLVKQYRFVNPGDIIEHTPSGLRYDHTETRFALDLKGIKKHKYNAGEFACNLAWRSLNLLRFKFLWGSNKHQSDVYLKQLNKIYRKFNIEIT